MPLSALIGTWVPRTRTVVLAEAAAPATDCLSIGKAGLGPAEALETNEAPVTPITRPAISVAVEIVLGIRILLMTGGRGCDRLRFTFSPIRAGLHRQIYLVPPCTPEQKDIQSPRARHAAGAHPVRLVDAVRPMTRSTPGAPV